MSSELIKIAIDSVPTLNFESMFEETRVEIVKFIIEILKLN